MKGRKILICALVFTFLGWLSAPFLALYPKWIYSKFSAECESPVASGANLSVVPQGGSSRQDCEQLMSQLGQGGDVFGSVTSLFSGLALFAVAFSLYADLSYRRKERKPLVACNIDGDNFLSFDKPTIDANPKSFYILGKVSVNSIAETAINASITPTLIIDHKRFPLQVLHIQVPLEANKSQTIELSDVLNRDAIDTLCANQQFLPVTHLEVKTNCSNLDGEKFCSEVTYNVTLRFPDNRNRIMSMRHTGQGLDGAWDDRSAILLNCALVPGSWKFSSSK